MPATKTTSNINDAIVSSIKQGQDLALGGLNSWTDFAGKVFPQTGLDALPFAGQLPNPKEVVDAGFVFVTELVAAQKELSDKLFELVAAKQTV